MGYTRKKWVDHITDQNGAIVQQGTPMSAGNFNNLEIGVANANLDVDNANNAIRDAIPSGLVKLSTIDSAYSKTNPNKIKLSGGGIAYVNGWKVDIPDGTIIDVGAPPTTGEREDLVFLEVWKDPATDTVGEKVNSRIRVAQGVDFTKYPQGLYSKVDSVYTTDWATVLLAQGSNTTVLTNPGNGTSGTAYAFKQTDSLAGALNFYSDKGLFIAGTGDQYSKDALKTADGYCYAIPLFRIRRRNSVGYSVANPNGAREYATFYSITGPVTLSANADSVITLAAANDITKFSVGMQLLKWSPLPLMTGNITIKAIDISTRQITITNGNPTTTYVDSNQCLFPRHDRPDGLFNNIIDDRDIIDLRHQVSLTGFNYQALLEENFDKLLRGELQTKERKKMLKVYHGIRKTPIDANTVFYASLDGTTVAEVGGALNLGTGSFKSMPTGLGYKFNSDSVSPVTVSELSANEGSIDLLIDTNSISLSKNIISLLDTNNNVAVSLYVNSAGGLMLYLYTTTDSISYYVTPAMPAPLASIHHVRCTWKLQGKIKIYIDGKVYSETVYNNVCLPPTKLLLGSKSSLANATNALISDVSISNIDRGAVFATLPQDFIQGYAKIDKAFNGQRKAYSDAVTSQYTTAIVRTKSYDLNNDGIIDIFDMTVLSSKLGSTDPQDLALYDLNKDGAITQADLDLLQQYYNVNMGTYMKGITRTQAGANWASGDTIKIKGLGGEIISGVIDSDTALARVVQSGISQTILYVDDVTKFAVNDTVRYFNTSSGVIGGSDLTITAIDATNKTITINVAQNPNVGDILTETTVSTSVPTVKFMNAGTLTTVAGTWTNLGTNEATFTLGTNVSLVNADIQIECSLNMVPGQGGIPEVYTQTLAGEYKSKKLVPGSVAVRDDLKNKAVGDGKPMTVKYIKNAALQLPAAFTTEVANADYTNMGIQGDELTYTLSTSVNGEIPQALVGINVVNEMEAKYGPIPSVDKVGWVKANLASLALIGNIQGVGPNGNKAMLNIYAQPSAWVNTASTNLTNALALVSRATAAIGDVVDSNGMLYFMVYTDASNGVVASTITIDSLTVELILKTPTGFDMLVPENPRRDDGAAGILLVRKETKEIQTYFDAVNTDGLVTYGDYVPYQGAAALSGKILAISDKIFITTKGTGFSPNTAMAPSTSSNLNNFYTKIVGDSEGSILNNEPISTNATSVIDHVELNGIVPTNMITRNVGDVTSFFTLVYSNAKVDYIKVLAIFCGLVVVNGALVLRVSTSILSGPIKIVTNASVKDFVIINKPLIK